MGIALAILITFYLAGCIITLIIGVFHYTSARDELEGYYRRPTQSRKEWERARIMLTLFWVWPLVLRRSHQEFKAELAKSGQ